MTMYRYRDQMYAGCSIDACGGEEYYSIGPIIECDEYKVVKETPKGYWIRLGIGDFLGSETRWVGKEHRKKFAHLTKRDALKSFIARKSRQCSILSAQLKRAEDARTKAKHMLETKLGKQA